jgi:uncharacterized membrane protein YccC
VSFRGISRTRVLAVLSAAAGMAISTFVGATAARLPWLLVPVIFAWAYAVGVLAAFGPTVLAVTLQWPVALLIASALPLGPADAAARAGLVLAGGLWQCLLVVSSWTVNRGSAERTALAASYTALTDYASQISAGRQGPPHAGQLPGSYALTDPNPLVRTAARQHMQDLADEAERIRATLTALSSSGGDDERPEPARGQLLAGTARVLTQIAGGLVGRPGQREEHLAAARRELGAITPDATTDSSWRWAAEALLGQLRSACRALERLNEAEPPPGRVRAPRLIRQTWRSETLLTLRASLGTSSESGRHALRLAFVTAAAELIVRAAGLSHGYWAVLTIFIVLRPDYTSTLYRGLQRAAGTVVGAGLGIATVQLARVSLTALLVGIGISLLAAYAVFTVNYLLYGVFLTDFVLVLLALLGLPPEPTVIARLAGAGLGTGLAILAYVMWPTWGATSAAENFARLFTAQGSYASSLLHSYAGPGDAAPARLSQQTLDARRARINAEASADRLAGEPDHPPITASMARALESAGRRIAQACLTLRAVVSAHRATGRAGSDPHAGLQPDLDRLADAVAAAIGQIAAALRAAGPDGPPRPGRLPPLRELQQAIWADAPGLPDGRPGSDGTAQPTSAAQPGRVAQAGSTELPGAETVGLFVATDSLVDAINTAAHALGAQQGRPAAPPPR